MSVINDIKNRYIMYYTVAAFMLFILILNNDTFLQNPICVKWTIPAYAFRDYSSLIRNSNFLSRKFHLLSRNYDSWISQLRRTK